MRKLVQFLLASLLMTLLACASTPETIERSHEHLGFEFPTEVGSFSLQSYHEYDDSRFGVVANYRLAPEDPLIVSAYVFPPARFDDGSAQPTVEHARDELIGLLNHYESGRQISWPDELAYSGRSGREIHQAALQIKHPDLGDVYSLLVLQEVGQARLKLRVSYQATDADASFHVRRFLEDFL